MKRYAVLVLVVVALGLIAVAGFSAPKVRGSLGCNLSVNPTHASAGGTVTLTGVVQNLGASTEKMQVQTHRIVNGQMVDIQKDFQVTLAPGATKTYTVPYTFPANEPNGIAGFHMRAWYNRGGLVYTECTTTVTIP